MDSACLILADSPGALIELCGVTVLERLLRTLQRCGYTRAIILSSMPEVVALPPRDGLTINIHRRPAGQVTLEQIVEAWPDPSQNLLTVAGDRVFDDRLLRALTAAQDSVVLVDSCVASHVEICAAAVLSYSWATTHAGPLEGAIAQAVQERAIALLDVDEQPVYSTTLRRELRPFWFPAPAPQDKKGAERILLNAAQKGSQDLPALVHAPIETFLVRLLCKTPITPNQLTIFCNIVAWLVTWCFATGALVWGTALALLVGVLDGLDGKQARVKVETSEAGKLEHWFDALFEFSWWFALAYYLRKSGQLPNAFSYLLLLLLAEGVDLAAKGSILFTYKKLIDELSSFDRVVRLFGGRRNIYVWILATGLLLGAPAKAFIVIAWWEVVTAAVHVPRAILAILFRQAKPEGNEV